MAPGRNGQTVVVKARLAGDKTEGVSRRPLDPGFDRM